MSSVAPYPPTSVPLYPVAEPYPPTPHYLLVTQDDAVETLQRLGVELSDTRIDHLQLSGITDPSALQQALSERLAHACVGLRLVLEGDEAFVWSLHALARKAGMQPDEIRIVRRPDGCRQVFCVHCANCQATRLAGPIACAHCGVVLEVRQHLSRRLGAYLGVCADPDQPRREPRP